MVMPFSCSNQIKARITAVLSTPINDLYTHRLREASAHQSPLVCFFTSRPLSIVGVECGYLPVH